MNHESGKGCSIAIGSVAFQDYTDCINTDMTMVVQSLLRVLSCVGPWSLTPCGIPSAAEANIFHVAKEMGSNDLM